ncbi:MAG: acid shock protein [Lachnospiraceae bacterium]|nr:acid shock protein [Lachnospiraceae bacterium]
MKKVLAFVLTLVMVLSLAACGEKPVETTKAPETQAPATQAPETKAPETQAPETKAPETQAPETKAPETTEAPTDAPVENPAMTHAEFQAAEADAPIVIEAAVQFSAYNAEYGNTSLYLADEAGGYFAYHVPVTAEEAAALTPGTMVRITGFKTEYHGLHEVDSKDVACEIIDGSYTAPVTDVTHLLKEDLTAYQAMPVAVKGAKIAESEGGAAFLYNWNGTGTAGSNSDLYFNVDIDGEIYSFTVETDEWAEGTDVYTAVTELQVGDTVDLEGFLYWYDGPQVHVHKIAKADNGVMGHAEFMALEVDQPLVIEGAVQFSAYSEQYGNTSLYLADEEGGYFVYRMPVTAEEAAKLTPGTKLRVSGFKAEYHGLQEIDGSTAAYEILDGSYLAPAIDITDRLNALELDWYQAMPVFVKNAKVVESEGGAAFLYNWNGTGSAGANNDLYFNIEVAGTTYTVTVETDECPEGSDVYTKVTELQVGDTIELEGFLYWYDNGQVHVHNVTKVDEYAAYSFQLKNKTGVTLSAAYFYPVGGVKGESVVPMEWLDKDDESEDNNYEQFVYLYRPVAEEYEWLIVTADGEQITWQVKDVVDHNEFSFKKGLDTDKWEASVQDAEEDVAAMDEAKALGKTADGFYPGYVKIGLELKNKGEEELAITEFYLYEKGASADKYPNVIGQMRDAENGFELAVDENGEPLKQWESGKGGLYLFCFFIRPVSEFYEVKLVFEDGSELIVEDIPNLVIPSSAGTLNNELSFKSATDPDATKIQFDDNLEDAIPYIAVAMLLGDSADGWYPAAE